MQLFGDIIFSLPSHFTFFLAMSSGNSFIIQSDLLNESLLQEEQQNNSLLFWQQVAEKGATITTTTDMSLQLQ